MNRLMIVAAVSVMFTAPLATAWGAGGCDPSNPRTTTICHVPPGDPANPQTLCVGNSAVKAHLANHAGDSIGACAVCGDGFCNGDEDCTSCPADCGQCVPEPSCGDGVCNGTETCSSCPGDCGACPPACGDGVCNGDETCSSCPADCGACPTFCCQFIGGSCSTVSDCSTCFNDPSFDSCTPNDVCTANGCGPA